MELSKGTAAGLCGGTSSLLSYGLRVPNPTPMLPIIGGMSQSNLDFHRAQVYDYNSRLNLQFALRGYPALAPYHHMSNTNDPFRHLYLYAKHDPRANFIHEEPKPSQSYIGLIAMAILSIPDKKMVLSDIYQYILDHYAYFRTRGPGWRNSIRHNLSLNDCFIKAGRSANGKGHYWAIHPANLEDFKKGDFRRRRAQRRVRKYLGLSVPDDEDSPSPPPPNPTQDGWMEEKTIDGKIKEECNLTEGVSMVDNACRVSTTVLPSSTLTDQSSERCPQAQGQNDNIQGLVKKPTGIKRRLFDMESLLAPDVDSPRAFKTFVASDLSTRRGGREGRDDSDTEINVADDLSCHEEKVSSPFSPDSGHGTLDQSSVSKGEDNLEGNVAEDEHGPLDLQTNRPRQPNQLSTGSATIIKIHPSTPAVLTNGLGMAFSSTHMLGAPGALCWPERPSAFQRMITAPVPTTLAPNSYSSLLVQARPAFPICVSPADSVTSAQKWQETLSRIMARSYDKNLKSETPN